jgi:hypothetical protein
MKTTLRIIAIGLLLFLGFGGIFGAWMLITDPSGGKFEWSLDLLLGTPFNSFLIPGIILMIANGILPLYISVSILQKKIYANWLILFQGMVVLGWLTAQLIFNPDFFVPEIHLTSYGVGILLGLIGWVLHRLSSRE